MIVDKSSTWDTWGRAVLVTDPSTGEQVSLTFMTVADVIEAMIRLVAVAKTLNEEWL